MIGSFAQVQTRLARNAFDHEPREVWMRIDAGSDRRAAQREFSKVRFDVLQPGQAMFDLAGVAAEFLP